MFQRFFVSSLLAASIAACHGQAVVTTGPAQPQPAPVVVTAPPASHPAYLHALTDLRVARSYLARPAGAVVKWDENVAIREIDAAINEIKRASVDDGKPLEDHPAVDVGMVWGDRLHRALELVEKARADVNQEEDNAFANGLKNRAVQHIGEAARFIHEGIEDAGRPNGPTGQPPVVIVEQAHPAYLHALTDLRAARGWLEKPARADVKFDENRAIREIDAAIGEIRTAAIDDGKQLSEHPPVDVAVGHRDRLRKAMDILHAAAADIEQREDDKFSKGLRHRALDHIRKAEKDIRDAIEDRKGR